eukprot:2403856-Rhodomonas_salina.1
MPVHCPLFQCSTTRVLRTRNSYQVPRLERCIGYPGRTFPALPHCLAGCMVVYHPGTRVPGYPGRKPRHDRWPLLAV